MASITDVESFLVCFQKLISLTLENCRSNDLINEHVKYGSLC